jgi:hypothetical protein
MPTNRRDDDSIPDRRSVVVDVLELAALNRARTALDTIANLSPAEGRAKARAFVRAAHAVLTAPPKADIADVLRRSSDELIVKAAAECIGDDLWDGPDAQALAASFIESIASLSLLDAIKRYARTIPPNLGSVLVATGTSAGTVDEGAPKVVREPGIETATVTPLKAAALIVLSSELARATGTTLFERELVEGVAKAANAAVLGLLASSGTTTITGTTDPLANLRAGIRAAGPSAGYAVAAPSADVAALSTYIENRGGMTVRGGSFSPGVDIVAVDDATTFTVIPASRLAVTDFGLRLAPTREASVDMRDSPQSPAQHVSLFQANCIGLLVERLFKIAGDTSGVVIVHIA